MDPDEKFDPKPDRFDQMSGYESGYRDGYHAARRELMDLFWKHNPLTDVGGGCINEGQTPKEAD